MTPKENIRAFVDRMPDDVTIEDVFYKLELFIGVYTGIQQIERGEYVDHDEMFDELLKEDAKEENNLVGKSKRKSARNKASDRSRLAKDSSKLRKAPKAIHK